MVQPDQSLLPFVDTVCDQGLEQVKRLATFLCNDPQMSWGFGCVGADICQMACEDVANLLQLI